MPSTHHTLTGVYSTCRTRLVPGALFVGPYRSDLSPVDPLDEAVTCESCRRPEHVRRARQILAADIEQREAA